MVRPGEGRWAPGTCLPTVHLADGSPIKSGTEAVSRAQMWPPARGTGQPCACARLISLCAQRPRWEQFCEAYLAASSAATPSSAAANPGSESKQRVWPKEG